MEVRTTHQLNSTRDIPWYYFIPVAGAPVAHVLVSMTQTTNNPMIKRFIWGSVVLSTASMIANRLYMLNDAWDEENIASRRHYYNGEDFTELEEEWQAEQAALKLQQQQQQLDKAAMPAVPEA